jgi:hypothetical protein
VSIIPGGPTDGGPVDPGRMLAALIAAATVLFLMCRQLRAPYNQLARNAAVAVYGVTLLGVVVYVALWLLYGNDG